MLSEERRKRRVRERLEFHIWRRLCTCCHCASWSRGVVGLLMCVLVQFICNGFQKVSLLFIDVKGGYKLYMSYRGEVFVL